jgi:hypothetical protein
MESVTQEFHTGISHRKFTAQNINIAPIGLGLTASYHLCTIRCRKKHRHSAMGNDGPGGQKSNKPREVQNLDVRIKGNDSYSRQ